MFRIWYALSSDRVTAPCISYSLQKSIESSSLAAANLDEYVMNSMDPAYTIDHKVSGAAPSTTSIFFQNTGQHLQKELDG